MKPTTFCLIRHGETIWNRESRLQGSQDIPLTDIGIEQAHTVARRLEQESWDLIISSDLARAKDTAQIINERIKTTHVIEPRLRERSFGILEGKTREEIDRDYPDAFAPDKNPDIEGLENYRKIGIRITSTLEKLARQNPGQRILVVTHGGCINALLYVLTGATAERIGNTALTQLTCDRKKRWKVESVNDCAHLECVEETV